MPYSYETFNGNGSNTDFAVNMPYLDRSHITLLVSGVSVSFTWVNDTLVRAASAPAAGSGNVEVKRTTPVAAALVDFEDASTLTETPLDTANLQSVYIAQERADTDMYFMAEDTSDNQFDAESKIIKNLANGVQPTDAVNKAQLDAVILDSGGVPEPADPDDDGAALVASGGTWTWTRTFSKSQDSGLTYTYANPNTGSGSTISQTLTAGTRSFTNYIEYVNAYARTRGTNLNHWYRDFDYHYWRSSAGAHFAQMSSSGLALGFGTQAAYKLDIRSSSAAVMRLSNDDPANTSDKSFLIIGNPHTSGQNPVTGYGMFNNSAHNTLYYGGWGTSYQPTTRHYMYAASAQNQTWSATHLVATLTSAGWTLGNSTNFAHIGGSGATADLVIGANGPNNGTGAYMKLHGSGHATSANVIHLGFANASQLTLTAGGSSFGNPTGGVQGAGTLNAEGLYVDGVAVASSAIQTHISARVNFSGSTPSLVGSYWGVSSVTDNGVGVTQMDYGVTFAASTDNNAHATLVGADGSIYVQSTATTSVEVVTKNTTPANADIDFNFFATGVLA